MTLGYQLMAARKLAGLSGDQIAEKLGVTKATVSTYETDRTVPGSRALIAWADACGCTVACLMSSEHLWRRLLTAEQCLRDLEQTEQSLAKMLGKRQRIRARRRP